MVKLFSQISQDITQTDDMIQYDEYAKNILSYACLQAWILKGLVKEFHDFSVQDICSHLTGKKQQGLLLDGERQLEMGKTEDTVIGQQPIRLDAYFRVFVPATNERIHINEELQKNPKVQKWLKKRGWYYVARMTTSQSRKVFEKDHYEKIEKVYSIWIVGGKRKKSRIEQYQLQDGSDSLDVMELIIVYLGDADNTSVSLIEQLLNTLFSATISIEKKKKILDDKFYIEMNTGMERTVEDMCNLSVSILETGREEGFEVGFEEGHEEGFEKGHEKGFEEGFEKAKRENVLSLASAGFSAERISDLLIVNIELVKEWIKDLLE